MKEKKRDMTWISESRVRKARNMLDVNVDNASTPGK